jgi:multiple sugar transport system permease protein
MRLFIWKLLRIVIVVAIIASCGVPLVWLFLSAFKHRVDMLTSVPTFFFTPTFDNFSEAFLERGFSSFILNSLIVSIASATLAAAIGVPAAYVFSRTRMIGRDHWLFFVLSTRMAPPAALALPYFLLFMNIGLLDSVWGLILGHTTFNLAFTIWTMKVFFDDIPRSVDDAARVDGLPHHKRLRLLIPSVLPGLFIVVLLCMLFSWNEFFLSMVLAGRSAQTLPVAILGLVTPAGTSWGQVAAIAVVTVVPILLLVIFGGRAIVRGLTFGLVKEN